MDSPGDNRLNQPLRSGEQCLPRGNDSLKTQSGGGEGGIRTPGKVAPTHAFQACSLNHSDTSPGRVRITKWRANCMTPARLPQALKLL